MSDKLNNMLGYLDVSKHIAHHIVGEDHTHIHRKAVGASIMMLGYTLAKMSLLTGSPFIHLIGELAAHGVEAIGVIPFVNSIEKSSTPKTIKNGSPTDSTNTINR